ncbi:MAG: MotA/TolQ/ExbB proton channel family protein, partial [Proteobacteria bacterium]|nr:MotA/TolQ/ExbB proton channel family protein [Pseudomonadota bacterium]
MIQGSGVSVIELIQQADIVVQSVMAILALASVWSWTIAFDKVFKFYILKIKTGRFERLFHSEKLDNVFNNAKKSDDHPFAQVFLAAMREWKMNNINALNASDKSTEKKVALKERISAAMSVASTQSLEKLENGLNFLAIIGSTAPFIGLFGTVWGIMNSFQSIAISKNTNISVVAPGIAEALLATA